MKDYRKIDTLFNWEKNPRTIDKKAFEDLKYKVQRFGQFKPVICTPQGEVIGGNMRLRAYKELGIDDVWVSIVEPKTEAEKLEIAIADNESAGRNDEMKLAEMIEEYKSEFDIDKYSVDLGKSTSLQDLINQYGPEPVEDEVPEVIENPKSKLGEIYQLGRHRVMCGDSTKIEDVERLMDGKKADMVFTDPPYGIGVDGQKKSVSDNPKHNRKQHEFRGWDDERPSEDIFNYIVELDIPSAIFGGNYFADLLPATRGWIFWGKGQDGSLTSSDGELAWTNKNKPLRSVTVNRAELQGSVHPTQKPISVVKFCLDYLEGGEKVLDLFLGSGSTLIACEQTSRICYGMEIDPKYCDVIRKRYAKFIGKEEDWESVTHKID